VNCSFCLPQSLEICRTHLINVFFGEKLITFVPLLHYALVNNCSQTCVLVACGPTKHVFV